VPTVLGQQGQGLEQRMGEYCFVIAAHPNDVGILITEKMPVGTSKHYESLDAQHRVARTRTRRFEQRTCDLNHHGANTREPHRRIIKTAMFRGYKPNERASLTARAFTGLAILDGLREAGDSPDYISPIRRAEPCLFEIRSPIQEVDAIPLTEMNAEKVSRQFFENALLAAQG
jgi:hypothetical protein